MSEAQGGMTGRCRHSPGRCRRRTLWSLLSLGRCQSRCRFVCCCCCCCSIQLSAVATSLPGVPGTVCTNNSLCRILGKEDLEVASSRNSATQQEQQPSSRAVNNGGRRGQEIGGRRERVQREEEGRGRWAVGSFNVNCLERASHFYIQRQALKFLRRPKTT